MKNTWARNVFKENINIQLPRSFVISLLFSLYGLAFILSPYWLVPATPTGVFVTLTITLVIGVAWSYFSADGFRISLNVPGLAAFLLLLAGVGLLNFQALRYDIPWRGDESFHLNQALRIVDIVSPKWLNVYLVFLGLFLCISWVKPKWAVIVGVGLTAAVIVLYANTGVVPREPGFFLRYPFVNYLIVSIPPILIDPKYPYHEFLFRLFPVLSTGLMAWFILRKMGAASSISFFLWAVAIVTIPIIFYYASIFYLEMPAALLMLVVSLDIENLLESDFEQIRKQPAWYALILIGFIKETAISFLFCFLLCRIVILLLHLNANTARQNKSAVQIIRRYLPNEVLIAFLTFFPLVFYITIRALFTDTRNFSPNLSNLFEVLVYPVLLQGFLEQFGIFLLLFITGCLLLILEKKYIVVFFYVVTFLFTSLFHVVDNIAYTGYSRFNLFVLPILLSGGLVAIKRIISNRNLISSLVACVVIAVNLWASPVFFDGSKKPLWGNYLSDTSEYYYPYQEALVWLEESHRDDYIFFVNGNFSYSYEFYFNQLRWQPNCDFSEDVSFEKGHEVDAIFSVLENAEKREFDIVVFQVIEKTTIPPQIGGAYRFENLFTNDAGNVLLIYTRQKQ